MPRANQGLSPYYSAYDERYRKVYAQGVEFWTAQPDEILETTESLDRFLGPTTSTDSLVLECGCGEGHLVLHLAQQGFRCIGVDISQIAIEKARRRQAGNAGKIAPVFYVADSTHLDFVRDGTIDILVDNYHLHMLVTDGDRRRYLAEVFRVLRCGGRAYFRENFQDQDVIQNIADFRDYLERTQIDLTTEEIRDAWQDGRIVQIKLPRLAARANNREGYCREFEMAGLCVQLFETNQSICTLHVHKPEALQ